MTEAPADLSRLRIDRDSAPASSGSGRGKRALAATVAIVLLAAATGFAIMQRGPAIEVQVVLAEFSGGGAAGGSILTANGYVVARTQASVSSKIMGRLDYLGVIEGSEVGKGDILARLDDRDYEAALREADAGASQAQAALAEAEASRDQLVRDLARSRELLARELISAQETESLASRLSGSEARVAVQRAQEEAAQASIEVARSNLENTRIRAPFAGTVLRKDAEVGEVVAPAATGTGLTRGAVLTMADLSTLEVEVDVNEGYIARIGGAQPAKITLDAYPDAAFSGRVRQILPTADRQRATVRVKVAILDHDPRILPEMGARVDFLEEPKPGGSSGAAAAAAEVHITVPADAVKDEAGQAVVWVVKDGRVSKRAVTASPVSGGRREIRQGLSGGEQVITTVHRGNLAEGSRVEIAAQQEGK